MHLILHPSKTQPKKANYNHKPPEDTTPLQYIHQTQEIWDSLKRGVTDLLDQTASPSSPWLWDGKSPPAHFSLRLWSVTHICRSHKHTNCIKITRGLDSCLMKEAENKEAGKKEVEKESVYGDTAFSCPRSSSLCVAVTRYMVTLLDWTHTFRVVYDKVCS